MRRSSCKLDRTRPDEAQAAERRSGDDGMTKNAAVAQVFAGWAAAVAPTDVPDAARSIAEKALLDVAGLCIAARDADYLQAALASWDADGPCTALGHTRALDAAGAAFINGTAAHGEDFDDSFEGTPVHAERGGAARGARGR